MLATPSKIVSSPQGLLQAAPSKQPEAEDVTEPSADSMNTTVDGKEPCMNFSTPYYHNSCIIPVLSIRLYSTTIIPGDLVYRAVLYHHNS